MLINKKDIIRINQEVGETGHFSNEGSLDFALSMMKHKKSWLYELSYLVRNTLIDHVFKDGNKRTALVLVITYFDYNEIKYDKQGLVNIITQIAAKNTNDLTKIVRLIKSVIIF